jgi:hypothetical protein
VTAGLRVSFDSLRQWKQRKVSSRFQGKQQHVGIGLQTVVVSLPCTLYRYQTTKSSNGLR